MERKMGIQDVANTPEGSYRRLKNKTVIGNEEAIQEKKM